MSGKGDYPSRDGESLGLQQQSFVSLGLRPSVIKALQNAFPNFVAPTETQSRLIPAILEGSRDILVLDETGTGKSFGILLGLLNKPRLRMKDETTGQLRSKLSITSLYLVPHKDLANQLYIWVKAMTEASSAHNAPALSSVAQVLVRDGGKHLTTGLDALKEDPPHILIATPQAVVDVCEQDPSVIPFPEISTVIVDEIDYLVEAVPRSIYPRKVEKETRRLRKHPGVTSELLSRIYESRLAERSRDEFVAEPATVPQLVVSSATVRSNLSNKLFFTSGWMRKHNTSIIHGPNYDKDVIARGMGGVGVHHSVLIVQNNEAKNISQAAPGPRIAPPSLSDGEENLVDIDATEEEKELFSRKPSPFDQQIFETIGMAFAMDVPSVALLVLDSSAPVHRAVYDLRSLGINAIAMDVTETEKGGAHLLNRGDMSQFKANPVLLVCTRATARGIDFPELTHVFIVDMFSGPIKGQLVDEYLHIAGRVGRFGRGGKVISFINDNKTRKDQPSSRYEVPRILRVLGSIGEEPVRFEHFD
ncbi:P-loop containing nucleoside triphosphate hydrolase protein [Hymenopellis radicata]|nr:P-loop containing nucleoside triphosphate hydrolase protein [Hymenopellis radicata]